jgi:hypothetical protein
MDQKFEGTPAADVRLEGRKVIRGEITNDWASKLQWEIRRDGNVVATVPARMATEYTHPDETPGEYKIVLQMFKYVNYKKDGQGNYTESKFIDISAPVTYKI